MNIETALPMLCLAFILAVLVILFLYKYAFDHSAIGWEDENTMEFHHGEKPEETYEEWWIKKLFMKQCSKCGEYYTGEHNCER